MELTVYSQSRLLHSANKWRVSHEYYDPLYNYLVHGLAPGGFFYRVLCNDWFGAIQSSHPLNSVQTLKAVSGWIRNTWPDAAFGGVDVVDQWLASSDDVRRNALEQTGLIYTVAQEVELALRDTNPERTLREYNITLEFDMMLNKD